MSKIEKQVNAYRFGSGKEPSDEMLRYVMSEVVKEAKSRQARAVAMIHRRVCRQRIALHLKWRAKIESLKNECADS